jgi:hypothetical protein
MRFEEMQVDCLQHWGERGIIFQVVLILGMLQRQEKTTMRLRLLYSKVQLDRLRRPDDLHLWAVDQYLEMLRLRNTARQRCCTQSSPMR